jgi:hypothetical protein
MYNIFTFAIAIAAPLPYITGGDWIFDCKLTAAPLPPPKLR